MYPKPVHDVSPVRLAIMQWQEKWTVMMSELGKDARIADLWRTASSVGISSKDPEEPMMMRQDEIGETRELQGEGGAIHDQQDRAKTRSTESNVCTDGDSQR